MTKALLLLLKDRKITAVVAVLVLLTVGFQNCSKVNFESSMSSSAVTGAMGSSLTLLATGMGIDPAGVTTFTAVPGQVYNLKLSRVGDTPTVLDNSNSSMEMIAGQCSGNSKYQPFTLDLTQAGTQFQLGDNAFTYSGNIADSIGGCSWKICAVDANGDDPACVTLIATTLAATTTTTTTMAPTTTTTTLRLTTTTTLAPTTTTTLRPTTTTTTLAPTTTTTTLRSTTTTTLPKDNWNCHDGWAGSCGQVIVDDAYVSRSNPGKAYIRTSPNIPNGTPNQYCACSSGTLQTIQVDCAHLIRYYICQ